MSTRSGDISKSAREFIRKVASIMESNSPTNKVSELAPSELHFELTYKCNTDCIICNLGELLKVQHLSGEKDLSLFEIKEMIERSSKLENISYIILSGGEPWLNKDFIEILKYLSIKYDKADFLILSNLFDTELITDRLKIIEKTVGFERISIGTSVDGIGKTHDKIRGVDGSFKALLETTLMIKKEFPTLIPCYNFTLIPQNSSSVFEVFKWAKKIGIFVSFQMFVQKKEKSVLEFSEKHTEAFNSDINRIIEYIFSENGWYEFLPEYLFDNLEVLFFLLNFHYMYEYLVSPRRFYEICPCGEKYAMINPSGDIYFCPVYKDMVAGNIRKQNFNEIWTGNNSKKARDFFNSKKCHCWLSCTNSIMLERAFFDNKEQIIRSLS